MAVITIAYLRIMLAFLEVTDKATALCHGDVFSLDNLRMAACAAKLFASFEVLEMNFMVKDYFFEFRTAFQKPFIVTPFLETAFVRYFSPWL
jgi:hypothetical protein